ncbi:MAG: hypothetical protein AB7S26_25980 [Sandaracinaceae bacterium]
MTRAGLAFGLAAVLVASPAVARATDVLVIGDQAAVTPWARALQLELVDRGWPVLIAPPVEGETVLERDGAAQRMARAVGADVALRIDRYGEMTTIRVVGARSDEAAVLPLPNPTTPPEALARISASYLTSSVDAGQPLERQPLERLSAPQIEAGTPEPAAPEPMVSEPMVTEDDGTGFFLHFGGGAVGSFTDRSVELGPNLTASIGWRAGPYVRAGAGFDVALMSDRELGTSQWDPSIRGCAEVEVIAPLPAELELGLMARPCGFIGQVSANGFFDGGRVFPGVVLGGAITFSAPVEDRWRLGVRSELAALALIDASTPYSVLAALSLVAEVR